MKEIEIIQGDCIHELSRLTRNKIRSTIIFADSPYNLGLNYRGTTNDRQPQHQFINWCRVWLAECYINLKDNGSLWVLINHENAADIEIILRDELGMTIANWLTWWESFGNYNANSFTRSSRRLFHAVKDPENYIFNKPAVTRPSARQTKYHDKRANPDGRLWDDVWGLDPVIPRVCGTHKERLPGYPTQLPLKLLEPIVSCASNPGDLVVDPFSGSGTTMEACLRLGRRGIGIEINPDYCDRSRTRIEIVQEALTQEKQSCLII